jgi:hypothetical protein
MVSGSSSSSANLTSTFTVPTSALGPTRMRVSMKYNAAQTACEVSLMEVEDYTVNIGGAAITTITTAKAGIDLGNEESISDVMYPNPADNILNVRMADSRKGTIDLLISLVNKLTQVNYLKAE